MPKTLEENDVISIRGYAIPFTYSSSRLNEGNVMVITDSGREFPIESLTEINGEEV